MRLWVSLAALCCIGASTIQAQSGKCSGLPNDFQLQLMLRQAGNQPYAGGLFGGKKMWGAIVNRDGELCSFSTSTSDPSQVWPGSQAIAKSKAYTANAFSLDYSDGGFGLSTARLYTFTQPGHSLWSLFGSNNFDPKVLASPSGGGGGKGQIPAGMIFFGGGVPLYREGKIVGALGVSGDTSCADHEIAKRVRTLAELDPPGGPLVDDIVYSPPETPSVFAHPICVNTWRNGTFIGNEKPETYVPQL